MGESSHIIKDITSQIHPSPILATRGDSLVANFVLKQGCVPINPWRAQVSFTDKTWNEKCRSQMVGLFSHLLVTPSADGRSLDLVFPARAEPGSLKEVSFTLDHCSAPEHDAKFLVSKDTPVRRVCPLPIFFYVTHRKQLHEGPLIESWQLHRKLVWVGWSAMEQHQKHECHKLANFQIRFKRLQRWEQVSCWSDFSFSLPC